MGLHGPGTLQVLDRAGTHEPLVRPLERVAVANHVVLLHRLLNSVAEIERFTGRTLPPVPDEIPGPHAAEIEGLAEALRQGGFMATMDSWKATMGSKGVTQFR